jgi:hypothetical protein
MSKQASLPHRYKVGQVFPPWAGLLPWVLPLTMASAVPEGEQR